MKKACLNKKLALKKDVVSHLDVETIKGGQFPDTLFCPTNGALNSCPPPGVACL
ncbi:hypothetical protein [Ascidiimonas aurantiaca]|uniref:hypothetical protein n=1 Tax=Ascidiimonas aurantiaca TaxID=1685432 RepID=UPI0030EB4E3D